MGLQINFDAGELTHKEAVGLARLLDAVSPGTLAAALPKSEAHQPIIKPLTATLETVGSDEVSITGAPEDSSSPSAPAGVDVDANGLPWDARIHSGNREKTADGVWRKRRGVHEETVRLVTEELRSAMAARAPEPSEDDETAPAPPPPVDPAQAFGAIEMVDPGSGAPSVGASAAPPPPPPAPAPPAAASADELFGQLMALVGPAKNAGKLTQDEITSVLQPYGLAALGLLMNRPDLTPQITETFRAIIESKG